MITNNIEKEWLALSHELSPEQMRDPRRVFYCGVLMALDYMVKNEFKPLSTMNLEREIRHVLGYHDRPNDRHLT